MFGSAENEHPRLTNGEIIFKEFQPMWSQSSNVTDRQTERQTDRHTTCDRNTALCTKVHHAVLKKKYNMWHDRIEEFKVDSKLSVVTGQLNLAHVARKKSTGIIRKTETNECQWPHSPEQVQDLWRQSWRNQKDYGGKDLWKRRVLSLEWKAKTIQLTVAWVNTVERLWSIITQCWSYRRPVWLQCGKQSRPRWKLRSTVCSWQTWRKCV